MRTPLFDRHYYDPGNWKLGFIYFCREDRRLMVPKRIRALGWTLNFARPLAVPFLGYLIALVLGMVELAGSFGAGGDRPFAIRLLLVLGVAALCYRLRGAEPDPAGRPGSPGGRAPGP